MNFYKDKIGIIGLGKLGLPMLSAFVKQNFNPIGFDINKELVNILKERKNPYKEPGIQDIIDNDRLWPKRFYDDLSNFISKVDTVFLIVPTPTKNKIFDKKYIVDSLKNICKILRKTKQNLTIVITSTVNPGDCDNFQKFVNKECKNLISIVYSPEFIALGSVLADMLSPDSVLLGGENENSINNVFSIYQRLYKSYPEFHRLSFFEAETAKIAINTFITTKISYANTIGSFIESATNSRKSAQNVLDAIGADSRIGRKYFKYGVSYGGPCFPRDNRALGEHLKKFKIPSFIPEATDKFNNFLVDYWVNKIKKENYDAIVIIGIAYKSGTDFLEESFMIKMSKNLKIPKFFFDNYVEEQKSMIKLDETHFIHLNKFKKVLVMKNYGHLCFDKRLKNLNFVDIWN